MNIKAYLEGDAGTEGSGQIGETLVGVNSQQLSVWQMEGGTEGGRKGGRERVRHWTTGGDKVDKKRRRYPKSSQTSLILPVSFFINYPLFPPFLPLPFVLFLISHHHLPLSLFLVNLISCSLSTYRGNRLYCEWYNVFISTYISTSGSYYGQRFIFKGTFLWVYKLRPVNLSCRGLESM